VSYVRREDVIGKKAITPDGNVYGEVKDIAFSIDGDVGLVIATQSGSESIVPIKQASAIGEFVLLSSATPQRATAAPQPERVVVQSAPTTCPSCGSTLRPGAKFCGKCGHKL